MLVMLGIASLLAPPSASANGTFGFSQRGVNTNMLAVQSSIAFQWPDESVEKFGEPQATYTYLAARGHKYVRIGFNWDVMQRGLTPTNTTAPLDTKYAQKLTAEITKAKNAGLKVVLVLGGGCEWNDRTNDSDWESPGSDDGAHLICGKGLTDAHAANLWRQVSALYKNEPAVAVYDLFNEPVSFQHPTRADLQDPEDPPYSAYKSAADASIQAIRANDDNKYVWVESLCCTLFHDFASVDPGGPWAVDPLGRIEFSQHMYPEPNPDSQGTYDPNKRDPSFDSAPGRPWSDRGYTTGFLYRLDNFGGWCRQFNLKCSIGEVGWPSDLVASAADAAQWNQLGDEFYYKADYYGLDVLFFGISTGLQGRLNPYGWNTSPGWTFPAPGINRSYSSASIIEKPDHLSQ